MNQRCEGQIQQQEQDAEVTRRLGNGERCMKLSSDVQSGFLFTHSTQNQRTNKAVTHGPECKKFIGGKETPKGTKLK